MELYLDCAEITYPADKDGFAIQDVLTGFGTDMINFTRLKVDKRGDVKATTGRHALSREGQSYHLPSFSLEQAQSDIELAIARISAAPPEPDYKVGSLGLGGSSGMIVRGYYAFNEEGFKTRVKGEVTIPAKIGNMLVISIVRSPYSEYGYGEITRLTIPDGVIDIGEYAFSYCKNLTVVTIPESVTSIGRGAFDKCENVVLHVKPGSYAEQYAKDSGIAYTIAE
jgi:hypothetical protein